MGHKRSELPFQLSGLVGAGTPARIALIISRALSRASSILSTSAGPMVDQILPTGPVARHRNERLGAVWCDPDEMPGECRIRHGIATGTRLERSDGIYP